MKFLRNGFIGLSKKIFLIVFFISFLIVSSVGAEPSNVSGRQRSFSSDEIEESKNDPMMFTIDQTSIQPMDQDNTYLFKAENKYGMTVAEVKFQLVKTDSGEVKMVPLQQHINWGYNYSMEIKQTGHEIMPGIVNWSITTPLDGKSGNEPMPRLDEIKGDEEDNKGNLERLRDRARLRDRGNAHGIKSLDRRRTRTGQRTSGGSRCTGICPR